jgi:hypothetical protein
MEFQDGLTVELPSPRDDEPASLRDDILDELADHLGCAYRREQLRGADAATARNRVLQQFGDPKILARRLWFEAMRGTIMSQRILVVCCVLLTAISLALVFVMWNQAAAARRLAAATLAESNFRTQRAELLQQQLLEQLQKLSQSANSARSSDWIPISFKLTEQTLDGPAAVGVQARMGRGSQGADKEDNIQRESDAQGVIDFGVVQPGDWGFLLRQGTKDGGSWVLAGTLNVLPGTSIAKSIVCPKCNGPTAPVSIHVDWPPDLADKGLALIAELRHEGFTYQPPLHWREVHDYDSENTIGVFHVLCGPKADRVTAVQKGSLGFWQVSGRLPVPGYTPAPGSTIPAPVVEQADRVCVDLVLQDQASDANRAQLLYGRNNLQKITIVRPLKKLGTTDRAERFELVARASFIGPAFEPVVELGEPPVDPVSSSGMPGTFLLREYQGIIAGESAPNFEARADEPNVWTIHLPAGLTQDIREKLKAGSK